MSASKYTSKLSGARVLVLGGTSGIGFCVAEAALEQNAIVIVASSSPEKVSKAVSRLQSSYPDKKSQVSGYTCDLSKSEVLEANIIALLDAATEQKKHKIDHVVNTAGDSLKLTPVSEYDVDKIRAAGTVRFVAPILLAKHLVQYINPGSGSSYTLTTGSNSARPIPGWALQAAYGAAKDGMVRGLAVDLAPLRVNAVSPGAIRTELFNHVPQGILDRIPDATLLGRIGEPEDTAEAYIYVMKDRYVTGTIITTDGGRLLK